MKTAQDPRHHKRIDEMQQLFSYSFHPDQQYPLIEQIESYLPQVDGNITAAAPEWPIDKIAKIDLAILRLAVYELLTKSDVPPKVVIDEAVELAKTYGNDNSAKFINGVLGTVLSKQTKSL